MSTTREPSEPTRVDPKGLGNQTLKPGEVFVTFLTR
jgi:hypothetical protein